MKKTLIGLIPVALLAPIVLVVGLSTNQPELKECLTDQTMLAAEEILATGGTTVRVAHANIPGRSADFAGAMRATVAGDPDFVSLNEMAPHANTELAPPGYQYHRPPGGNTQARSTAVLWRADRWTKVDGGRLLLVSDGPQQWDAGRSATWATLESPIHGQVSIISTHLMINPAKHGPNQPLRQDLYRKAMVALRALAATLEQQGPVFIAGDFNSQWQANDPWGPRTQLAPMVTTFDRLGAEVTHQGGATIDMIFYSPTRALAVEQKVQPIASDHRLLTAAFELPDAELPDVSTDAATDTDAVSSTTPASGTVAGLTLEQTRNAATIVATGRKLKVPDLGLVVALAVALQESGLRNLKGGDADSMGLFQQRPKTGWGTRAEIQDPIKSAQAFFGRAAHTDTPGLLDIQGWETIPLTEAAQAVQRSAYPSAYADDEHLAQQILAGLDPAAGELLLAATGEPHCQNGISSVTAVSGDCAPTTSPAERGLTPDALRVLRCVDAAFGPHTYGGVGERASNPGSDHPAGRATDVMIDDWQSATGIAHGDAVAEWVRAHSRELGVTYVIWRARIWRAGDTSWSPYGHPSGATDPTSLHMDHVHVSVTGDAGTGFPDIANAAATISGGIALPLPAGSYIDQNNYGQSGPNWESTHTGNDYSAPCGTPVFAVHAGTVSIDTTTGWAGPWLVEITTGGVTTSYAHMQALATKTGQTVRPGQPIGKVGNEGNSTGCHLHLEATVNKTRVDPHTWLATTASSKEAA